ncbi:methyltransferase domain-containing protein [Inquilinus limosus]|uniref:SAM-dependent methyltransferase n=1 Tax=Inquilinus limosus MP06 TaxID=1398085 RepID=A0A0A0CX97_9PROT|nr:methyltransferase domain-containing protein [Inquilinus limosus]KGM30248.1 SAM-dependent methyltransferase [Inquilinus limosus MP06]
MTQSDEMMVFDRALVRRRRDRAAPGLAGHGFLFEHVAAMLADRLLDVTRRFPVALDLGCHDGTMARALERSGRIDTLVQADLSPALARSAAANGRPTLACDEELLPFGAATLDLVLSNLSLHWVNDLPGALLQIRQALRPDGLFLAAMLGAGTLAELRTALVEAETELMGGASPRLSPFADLRDAAGLLQRAGFALPVADAETVIVSYENAFRLIADLRGMGETNAGLNRNPAIPPRAFWPTVATRYAERFAEPDGRIPASFEVLFLAGWAPHDSQQRPRPRGSATRSLAEALGTVERPVKQ